MEVENKTPVIGDDGHVQDLGVKNLNEIAVKIGDNYYFRWSNMIVCINDPLTGESRYFRKESPLILKYGSAYYLKKRCVKLKTGGYIPKHKVAYIDGEAYDSSFCVKIENKYYLKNSDLLYRYDNIYHLKSNGTKLCTKYYAENKYVPNNKAAKTSDGDWVLAQDCHRVVNSDGECSDTYVSGEHICTYEQIDWDFKQPGSPDFTRLTHAYVEYIDNIISVEFITSSGPVIVRTHPKRVDYFTDAYRKWGVLQDVDVVRKQINSNYDEQDGTENKCTKFVIIKEPFPGKKLLSLNTTYSVGILADSCEKFTECGGIRYTFGAEFETSQGMLTSNQCESVNVKCVGDRSIGAGEYVTPVLRSNLGLKQIDSICSTLSEHCLVDNRCGFHVHIGNENEFRRKTFHINIIRLCAIIEDQLFKILPPSRSPQLYHCHSIKRWQGINRENYSIYMGAYIFGEKEWWNAPTTIGTNIMNPYFDFNKYKITQSKNRGSELDPWHDGRYKWLNLYHCFANSGYGTVEFRLFPGTTNAQKAKNFILLSMAIVKFANDNPRGITPNITLEDIIRWSFKGSTEIVTRLIDFINERKRRFGRVITYPDAVLNFSLTNKKQL